MVKEQKYGLKVWLWKRRQNTLKKACSCAIVQISIDSLEKGGIQLSGEQRLWKLSKIFFQETSDSTNIGCSGGRDLESWTVIVR